MANGETINQVKQLLEDPKGMTVKSALILSLQMQADFYEQWMKDHTKLEEIYPYVKEQRDNNKSNSRLAIGAAITSTVLLLFHIVTESLGIKAP